VSAPKEGYSSWRRKKVSNARRKAGLRSVVRDRGLSPLRWEGGEETVRYFSEVLLCRAAYRSVCAGGDEGLEIVEEESSSD
jgi:hypothetical protein